MRTAAYTICKNEIKKVEQWLYYTKDFDHRVILDTGSTDGTYEALAKVPGIILQQYHCDPDEWRYDVARRINLSMVPEDVDWCLSPDMDEYYSINVLDRIAALESQYPKMTIIGCARLDIYSDKVFVGKPDSIGTNKVHRRHLYTWAQPIYEHLSYCGPDQELEVYDHELFLIHDQDITKPRNVWYPTQMKKEFDRNPRNNWNNWFLANHYFREQDLEGFVGVAVSYLTLGDSVEPEKATVLLRSLGQIAQASNVPTDVRETVVRSVGHLLR
jgi:hypothetical protein